MVCRYGALGKGILLLALLFWEREAFGTESITYRSTILISADWGVEQDQFGLMSGPEREPIGPNSFAIAPNGEIYILDTVNTTIKKYDDKGGFLGNVGANIHGSALCVSNNRNIFVRLGSKIIQYSTEGQLTDSIVLPEDIKLIGGYGQDIKIDKQGTLWINRIQETFPVGQTNNGELHLNHQKAAILPADGFLDPINEKTVKMNWKNVHLANIEAGATQGEKSLQEMPMTTSDAFGAVLFLGFGADGLIFTEVERISEDNYVHLEFRSYDRTGQIQSNTEVPNLYFTAPNKKLEVAADGAVYQLLTTAKGVQITKWKKN